MTTACKRSCDVDGNSHGLAIETIHGFCLDKCVEGSVPTEVACGGSLVEAGGSSVSTVLVIKSHS